MQPETSSQLLKQGLISVVIPCYNATPYIAETLETVFAQSGVEFEVIVVDDGSQDGGADLVASRFPSVRLFRNPNQGPSAARNFGTARARGEFIQYLDADDLLAPEKLRLQLAALLASDADVAYGNWNRFRTEDTGARTLIKHVEPQLKTPADIDLFIGFWCPPAAYLVRRSLIDRVGGWNPKYPVIQDARFMLDCALHGARFVRCEGLMAEYRVHQSNSVSTRSRRAFLNDCLQNGLEIRDWWAARGELNETRRRAVVEVLDSVAIGSLDVDRELFDQACQAIAALNTRYLAHWPIRKKAGVALLGYRSAVLAAHHMRGAH